MLNKVKTKCVVLSLWVFMVLCSSAHAELKIDSVYPSIGKMGEEEKLEVTISGSGFDKNTRVSMAVDTGSSASIMGSVETPGRAEDVFVLDGKAYVADGKYGLQVVDIGNPAQPQIIASVDTTGWAYGLFVLDGKAYVADGASGLQVVDITNPAQPIITGCVDTPGLATDVFVLSGKAYVADGASGLQVVDITNPAQPLIIGFVDTPGLANDVFISDNKAYVADGKSGIQIIDIAKPANAVIIGYVDTPDGINPSLWNGAMSGAMGVTVVDSKAYVANGYSGLLVIDITEPTRPVTIGSLETSGFPAGIFVADGKAYIADGISGLSVVDITDSTKPSLIGSVKTTGIGTSLGVVVQEGIAYVAEGDGTGLDLIDINNLKQLPALGYVDTIGYAWSVSVLDDKAYIANGDLQVIDVKTPAKPAIVNSINTLAYAADVTIINDKAYIANTYKGLAIIDISNPKNPIILGTANAPEWVWKVAIWKNNAYVLYANSDLGNPGLSIIDITDPKKPILLGSVGIPAYGLKVTVADNKAYVANALSGLQVVDVSDPAKPVIISSVTTGIYTANDVTIYDNKAYVAGAFSDLSGLQVIDVTDPVKPVVIGSGGRGSMALYLLERNVYLANSSSRLQVVDITTPAKPIVIGAIDTKPQSMYDIAVANGKAYLGGDSGLVIVPVPLELTPTLINSNTISVTIPSQELAGQYNIRVFNDKKIDPLTRDIESSELPGAVSFFEPAEYWELVQKKAIIVAGRSAADDVLWNSTKTCTNMAYRALLTQGYTRNTIQYLNPENLDADHDGALNDVDDDADLSTLEYAISNWAADTNELLLYMTDHGGDGTFRINPTEIVTAQELDKQLDAFQNRTHARVILVYDACLSGSFIDYLQPPGSEERIIITSTKPNESSYFNGPEGQISFSYQFWSSVMLNGNLNAAFTAGDNIVTGHTPQLDGNGDGVTNQSSDYSEARAITICRGRSVKREPPRITGISPDQTLSGETSATICVEKVTFTNPNPLDRIFAIIEPPGLDALPADIPITDLPSVELAAVKDSHGNLTGKYEAVYDEFTLKGTYKISVYAVDKEEIYSNPARTNVIQTVGETSLLVLATPKGGIYNKTQNVQLVASPADAAIYYTVDDSNPDPSSTADSNKYTKSNPITISKDTVLKFIAIDSSGSKSPVYTENYTIDTIAPSSPDINLPENNNFKIITNPYPTFYWKAPKDADYCTLQYSKYSDFSNYEEVSYLRGALFYTVSTPLSECGNWYWRIKSVDKAGNQSDWSGFEFSFEEDTAIHKAIIVSTGDIDPNTDANFKIAMETITSQAYTALTWQNYEKSNIYLLSSDNTFDADKDGNGDVSATLTKADFERAITNWASDADDLIIFMVGQGEKENLGEKGSFRLNSTETVTGTELDLWIDTLQSTADVKVRIVYDATASGSFIPLLLPPQGKERITIASTPVIESDSSPVTANFPDNGGLSFSYQFWFNIRNTAKLYDSYRIGHEMMTGHKQYATYDANGNGITYDDDDGEDGDFGIISKIKIGYGRIAASSPPVIGSVCSSQIVTQTQVSTKSFSIKNIWVSNIASLNPIAEVMAIVSKPVNNQDIVAGQTSTPFDEILLQDIDGDKKYEGSYSDQVTHNLFELEGTYTIAIYAKDSQGYYSPPVTTTVTVVKDGDNSNYAILTEKSPAITIAEGVHVKVIGSAGANIVNVGSGAKVECINFPGQNQINIEENSSNFTIKRSGAMVYLQSTTTGTMVKIPATLANQTIKFTTDNKSFTLVVKNSGAGGAKVMLESLEVGLSEIQV